MSVETRRYAVWTRLFAWLLRGSWPPWAPVVCCSSLLEPSGRLLQRSSCVVPSASPPLRSVLDASGHRPFSRRFRFHFRLPQPERGPRRIIDDAQPPVLTGDHDFSMNGRGGASGFFVPTGALLRPHVGTHRRL